MSLSTLSILDPFRARPVVLDHEAGKGADRGAAPALDRVDDPQVGIPAIADDRGRNTEMVGTGWGVRWV
jgi:hypothetical protein